MRAVFASPLKRVFIRVVLCFFSGSSECQIDTFNSQLLWDPNDFLQVRCLNWLVNRQSCAGILRLNVLQWQGWGVKVCIVTQTNTGIRRLMLPAVSTLPNLGKWKPRLRSNVYGRLHPLWQQGKCNSRPTSVRCSIMTRRRTYNSVTCDVQRGMYVSTESV